VSDERRQPEQFSGVRGRKTAMTVEEVAQLLNVSERHV
jgi:hypothetical protein